MDPKLLVKSSKIVGSAPQIQFRKNQKNRPSSFELEKCFVVEKVSSDFQLSPTQV